MRGSALIFCAWLASGCNTVTCGPGTVLVANQCQVVSLGDGIPCDVDGGDVEIVGGKCVSRVKCAPPLMYDPFLGCYIPEVEGSCPPCPSPIPPGSVCVTGGVVDLSTMKHLPNDGSARPLRIGVYEPLGFFDNPNVAPLSENTSTSSGCFTFTVPVPASSALVVAAQDPVGTTPTAPLTIGTSGLSIVAGQKYQVDGYMVKKSLVDNWSAADPAFLTEGSVVDCFYNVAPGAPTNFRFDEQWPTATGVQLTAAGMMSIIARYLEADASIDSSLTATGSRGCAVVAGGSSYSFQGGGVNQWEKNWSGTTTGVVFVQAIRSCDSAPAGTPGCN